MFRILIIDDEIDLLELYAELLSNDRRKIETCDSGKRALDVLNLQNFNVVICDKKMGAVSGLDVLKVVEAESPQTVFLLTTGDDSEKINFQHKKSKLILKPFSFPQLDETLTKLEKTCDRN